MLYTCTHMATVGVKGLREASKDRNRRSQPYQVPYHTRRPLNPNKDNEWTSGVPLNPFAILGNVFGVEKLARRRVFTQFVFTHRTTVHEGLSNDRQTGVDNVWLANVKHKVWVLYDVYPEPQRQATHKHIQQFLDLQRKQHK